MNRSLVIVLASLLLLACKKKQEPNPAPSEANTPMYFPGVGNSEWATQSFSELGWKTDSLQALKDFLVAKNTKSFMILVNGKIVMEEYMNGHQQSSTWQWNSAGKTLVATTVGIAQQEGLLSIDDKVSRYVGENWTSETLEQENLITNRNLLTMTSGLNNEKELVIKSNLTYVADAGKRWSYHNVFQRLMDIVAAASKGNFETYFNIKVKNKIGMEGSWKNGVVYKVYFSNTRSMARFGLLALNSGKWNGEQIINETYFKESINSSQTINPAYGYLWWLNGKSSFMVPGSQIVFPGALVANAPLDMYAAMGADEQRIYVIPSKNMVIVRMGDASDPLNTNFALSGFDNQLWDKINSAIK